MTFPIPGPVYRIHTRRLVLRCWEPSDAPRLKAAIDASIEHLLPWMPFAAYEPQPLQHKIELIRKWRSDFDADRDFVYGVFSRDETQVIGSTGLHTRAGELAREIGYWIHKVHTRQGYATETAAALTRVAFAVDKVERVEIHCDAANAVSGAIAQNLGYTLEAKLRKRVRTADGELRDMLVWTMLADEYLRSPLVSARVEAFDVIGRRIL